MIDATPKKHTSVPLLEIAVPSADGGGESLAMLALGLFCMSMPLGNTTLAVLVSWLALVAQLKKPVQRERLFEMLRTHHIIRAAMFFVVTLFISAAFSADRLLALAGACGYSLVVLAAFLVGFLWEMPSTDWLLRKGSLWLSLGGLISAGSALYRVYALHIWRPGGLLISTNGFASVMLVTLLITWWALTTSMSKERVWMRGYRLACWLIMLWGLIVAQGRGAWVGFAIGFSLYNMRSLRGVLTVAATTGFCLLGVSGNPRLVERALSILTPDAYRVRLWIWQGSLAMWRDHPLVGIGPGTFTHQFERYRPIEAIEGGFNNPISFAHNLFLGLLTEVGLLGTVAFLFIVGTVAWAAWKWLHSAQGTAVSHSLVWAIICSLIALIAREMVDNTIFGLEVGGAFWALLAWLAVLTRVRESGASGA